MREERENQKYKECGPFNVVFDYVSYDDGSYTWEISIEYIDGFFSTLNFDKYEEALVEYNRWGF